MSEHTPSFAPSTNNTNEQTSPMKTKRTSIEPAVMTIGQVCLLLLMFVVVPF